MNRRKRVGRTDGRTGRQIYKVLFVRLSHDSRQGSRQGELEAA